MDVRLRKQPPRRLHKRINKLIVPLSANPPLPQAQVQLVAEEIIVVGAAVEDDGEGAVGVDAGAGGGEDELGYGDEDAAGALVADAQDLLAV